MADPAGGTPGLAQGWLQPGWALPAAGLLPKTSRDLGSCGGCRDSPVSCGVPHGTLGLLLWHLSGLGCGLGHGVSLWGSKEEKGKRKKERNNAVSGRKGEQPEVPTCCTR